MALVTRRYDVAHRQLDRALWVFAATIGALRGCPREGSEPFDTPSTPSASSRENGMFGGGLDVRGSFAPAGASGLSPDQLPQGAELGIPPKVDPGTPIYAVSSAPIAVEP